MIHKFIIWHASCRSSGRSFWKGMLIANPLIENIATKIFRRLHNWLLHVPWKKKKRDYDYCFVHLTLWSEVYQVSAFMTVVSN